MKKLTLNTKNVLLLGAFMAVFTACQTDQVEEADLENLQVSNEVITGQYIVTYNDGFGGKAPAVTTKSAYKSAVQSLKSKVVTDFKSIGLESVKVKNAFGYAVKGFVAELNEKQLSVLRKDPRIKNIEQDRVISLPNIQAKPGSGGGATTTQSVPYGITRIGGAADGTGKTAWIIDTGIDLDHPDLNVDVSRSASFVRDSNPNDQNGHGTHVAGTVAAINNNIGVVGVAAGATVIAVRVLDRRGSGSISGVIGGVDYVAANGAAGDAANMSLGGGVSTTLDQAVIDAAATGIKFALAAGNESDDAINHSPARAEGANIYTISAMDINDNFAYFSNYGAGVDYCEPGVSITSTWIDGGYNTISGTSMAAPHACGILLFGNLSTGGFVNNDPDGNPDPIGVR